MFTSRKRTATVGILATASLTAALGIFGTGASAAVQSGVAITGLSVVKGATTSTTNLMVTGTGFSKLTEAGLKFGDNASTKIIVLSDTQMAAVAPTGTAGKVDVQLTDTEPAAEEGGEPVVTAYPLLSGTSATKDDFTYLAPYNATVAPGTMLNSLGGGKLTVTSDISMGDATTFPNNRVTATIGGLPAAVTRVSDTSVTLTVPAAAASKTAPKVVLIHDGVPGTPSTAAKYAAVISATDKVGGPTKGGDSVTITGKGLKGATAWKFGGESATCTPAVAPADDTKVTCVVPAAADADPDTDGVQPVAGPVDISFTPAAEAPYAVSTKASWTYSDLV